MQLSAKAACPECHGSPADHWFIKTTSTLEVAISSLGKPAWLSGFFSAGSRVFAQMVMPLLPPLFRAAEFVGVVSRQGDLESTPTKRSRAVWQEAKRRGVPMRQYFVFGIPTEFFEAVVGGKRIIFYSIPIPPAYRGGALWADDKHLLKNKLKEAEIAAPRSFSVSTRYGAKRALAELAMACVKPRNGSNGFHTFPHVSTEDELVRAFASAKKLCHFVVVEEHLEGNLGRATCVNGVLIGFLESHYPTVVGDGQRTVRELIDKANKNKPAGVADIVTTPVHERYIARRGHTFESVLKAGEELPLVYWAGYSSGGRNVEHGANVNSELRAEIERAARLTKLPVVGFDLIIQDPKKSPLEQKWGIIEANSLPWIDLHLTPLTGTPVNVAQSVWDLWK